MFSYFENIREDAEHLLADYKHTGSKGFRTSKGMEIGTEGWEFSKNLPSLFDTQKWLVGFQFPTGVHEVRKRLLRFIHQPLSTDVSDLRPVFITDCDGTKECDLFENRQALILIAPSLEINGEEVSVDALKGEWKDPKELSTDWISTNAWTESDSQNGKVDVLMLFAHGEEESVGFPNGRIFWEGDPERVGGESESLGPRELAARLESRGCAPRIIFLGCCHLMSQSGGFVSELFEALPELHTVFAMRGGVPVDVFQERTKSFLESFANLNQARTIATLGWWERADTYSECMVTRGRNLSFNRRNQAEALSASDDHIVEMVSQQYVTATTVGDRSKQPVAKRPVFVVGPAINGAFFEGIESLCESVTVPFQGIPRRDLAELLLIKPLDPIGHQTFFDTAKALFEGDREDSIYDSIASLKPRIVFDISRNERFYESLSETYEKLDPNYEVLPFYWNQTCPDLSRQIDGSGDSLQNVLKEAMDKVRNGRATLIIYPFPLTIRDSINDDEWLGGGDRYEQLMKVQYDLENKGGIVAGRTGGALTLLDLLDWRAPAEHSEVPPPLMRTLTSHCKGLFCIGLAPHVAETKFFLHWLSSALKFVPGYVVAERCHAQMDPNCYNETEKLLTDHFEYVLDTIFCLGDASKSHICDSRSLQAILDQISSNS